MQYSGQGKTPAPEAPGFRMILGLANHDCEHVASAENQVLLATELDLGAAVLAKQNLVAYRHVNRDALASVVEAAWTYGNNLGLLWLLLGGSVRNNQTRCSYLLGWDWADNNTVFKWLDLNRHDLPLFV
jgi:hypothetical protein